jgi:hypothetical protein
MHSVILYKWIKHRRLKNQSIGAARTVYCIHGTFFTGGLFYSLATGSMPYTIVPKSLQRNMPDLILAIIMARLAVDADYHGNGMCAGLLHDCSITNLAQGREYRGMGHNGSCYVCHGKTILFASWAYAISHSRKKLFL